MANPQGCNQYRRCAAGGRAIHKGARLIKQAYPQLSQFEAHSMARSDLRRGPTFARKVTGHVDALMRGFNRGHVSTRETLAELTRNSMHQLLHTKNR